MENTDRLPRKLAAILYADVVGYSRLAGEDEDTTHRRLTEYLDLFAEHVERHGGRVTNYAGDAVLAMFDSVVEALLCAAHIPGAVLVRIVAGKSDELVQRNRRVLLYRNAQIVTDRIRLVGVRRAGIV